MYIEERTSTHIYRQKRMLTKEELTQVERLCVHEQPAYCVAACPLKLDTKALILAIAQEDWRQALTLYEKITPFPHLLCAGCEAPCQDSCKLCSLEGGEGIAIRQLEQAVAIYGEKPKTRGLPRMKKKKTAAIFGSGLYCLFLAGELHKKAYPVTLFCQEPDLTAFLQKETEFMTPEGFSATLQTLSSMDISFVFSANLSRIHETAADFDIICCEYALAAAQYDDLDIDPHLMFSRTHHLVTGPTDGVLSAAYAAKRAALTADRLAQNLDPSNTRGEEGAVETQLFTDMEGVLPSHCLLPADMPCTKEQAVAEARRCIQCRCDACIRGCAYLQHYHKFPRVLTREIYNNVSIIMGDHMMNKPINACSLCGQCTVICPNGYDMGEICHMARQNMVSTGKMPLAPHEFALMDMMFSNGEAFLCRKQPGFDTCRYVFFPGCQAGAIAPDTVFAAYKDLCSRLEGGVALILGCCGAICDWAGRYTMYEETVNFLNDALAQLGNPTVIAGCPTCMKELSGHGHTHHFAEPDASPEISDEDRSASDCQHPSIIGIWDILTEIGLPQTARGLAKPAALHDSCGARGDAHTQQSIRQLALLMGCELVETPYSGDRSPCCGYGGLTAYANREVAKEMTQKCLERSDLPYISYCMACRDRFAREGRESRHILELIYGTHAGAPPDISEKRYNRLTLKNKLLQDIWGEEIKEMNCDFQITYTEEALTMMDDRMILKSDVVQVLQNLRTTGEAVFDSETGLCVTRMRLGNVTFWVKYEETEDGYLVHRAYSHRMNVVRRQG